MSPTGPRRRLLFAAVGLCLAAVLAAGLALGAVSTGAGAQAALADDVQPRIVQEGNTSNYLQPERDAETRDGFAYQDVDIGLTVASGAETLHGQHERLAFDRRFQDAATDEAQLETFRTTVATLEGRTNELRAAYESARTNFRDGSLSTAEYFRELARLSAATDRLAAHRDRLEDRVGEVGPEAQPSLTELQSLEADLETMDGPVSDYVSARYTGNASGGATMILVTGDGGYVVSTANDGVHYRVGQESADWNRDGVDQFPAEGGSGGLSRALERAASLYSWTFAHQFGSPPPRGVFGDTVLYKIGVVHQHGELTVYLDGSTEEVFREVQLKRLNAVPRNWTRGASAEGVQLTINGSFESGPMDVSLTEATADGGLDGDVRIDGQYVGSTNAAGRLQTVQPYGSFTVNATTADNRTVAVTIPERPS